MKVYLNNVSALGGHWKSTMCSFEIGPRFIVLVHNQVTPPIVGNTILSFNKQGPRFVVSLPKLNVPRVIAREQSFSRAYSYSKLRLFHVPESHAKNQDCGNFRALTLGLGL